MEAEAISDTVSGGSVTIPLTYKELWDDGFFVRGWKLDAFKDDANVIAVTSYTGEKVPTSVLVHDIVDHYLCGFKLSGHRNEIMAVMQLKLRTGTEIDSSYGLMVDEFMGGSLTGETPQTFLPPAMAAIFLRCGALGSAMEYMAIEMGAARLRAALIRHCYNIGLAGIPRAIMEWNRRGLDYAKRKPVALALQGLLEDAEKVIHARNLTVCRGQYRIDAKRCYLILPDIQLSFQRYIH